MAVLLRSRKPRIDWARQSTRILKQVRAGRQYTGLNKQNSTGTLKSGENLSSQNHSN